MIKGDIVRTLEAIDAACKDKHDAAFILLPL